MHMSRCGELAVRADMRVHAVTVLPLDLAENVSHNLRTEPVIVVVNGVGVPIVIAKLDLEHIGSEVL
jgi:hypothetical protein